MALGDEPNWLERFYCQFGGSDPICYLSRRTRYAEELAAQQHAQELAQATQHTADLELAALQAERGVDDEVQSQHFRQLLPSLLLVGAAGAVVVVGIGGYLWWTRSRPSSTPLSSLSDDELERLILERQIEAGLA